jgi:hypothetical protein
MLRHRARAEPDGTGVPAVDVHRLRPGRGRHRPGPGGGRRLGLTNVSFEVHDVARLPSDPPSTAVSACDAIHDQADPADVLSRVRAALEPSRAR